MSSIRQFLALMRVNLAGITQRLAPVLTIIIGVTCAVGVLVSMLAMGTGASRQQLGTVRADRVILITTGGRAGQSSISRDEASAIRNLPRIRKGANGEPIVSLESTIFIEGRRRGTGKRIYFPLLGVTPNLTDSRPEIRFTDGRMFKRGLHEAVASNACVRQFVGFELGARRPIRGIDWAIVGHLDPGETQQCVVYADVDSIMSAFSRNTYSSITVRLQSPQAFAEFRQAVAAIPSLKIEVQHESAAVQENFKPLNAILNFVSYFVGTIMAIGATLGAVNSLYAIVDSRRRELATLRAIGFGSGAIVMSILCESMLLAVPGALLGAVLAWILFNGLAASPFGYSFQLAVTPALAALGIVWALGMGLLGGLLPAIRAARLPITTALRAT